MQGLVRGYARAWKTLILGVSVGLLAAAPPIRAEEPPDAILILDASGSMWGQIGGVNKIVIAKDTVEGLIRSLPASQRLGFVAYGHRREGDCKDIETLADLGADRGDVIDQLRSISPRGKTPLTRSVEHAAHELNYRKSAATVILVSDGLENCDADPCALARTLEENGLDFTVHVVGFDVTEEERSGLMCIAEETGGRFLAADNAEELADALTQISDAAPAAPAATGGDPVPSTLALKATILSGGPLIQSGLDWVVTPAGGGEPVFTQADAGPAETEILPGDYEVTVTWTGWRDGTPKTGRTAFTVRAQQPKVLTVPVDLALPLSMDSPAETPEGVPFEVTWSGPDDLGAYIQVARPDDGPRSYIYGTSASKARASHTRGKDAAALDTDGDGDIDQEDLAVATIAGPSVAGQYVVRYLLDTPRLILARRPLTVTDSTYVLSVPEEVPAATEFQVVWEGPLTDGDFVTMIEAGSKTAFQNGRTARLVAGKPAALTAPAEPGDYEIRYILANAYTLYPGMQHVIQASAPIRVTDVAASVDGPAEAVGGSTVEVRWEGPTGWEDDYVSVIEPGTTKPNQVSRSSIASRGKALNPVGLRVPDIPGDYEIAYFLAPGERVLARRPIKVVQAEASVDAPTTVKAGTTFSVRYSGPAHAGDRVVVAPAGTPDAKMWGYTVRYGFAVSEGSGEGKVTAYPIQSGPGEYEVRYVTGLQNQVIARDRFSVVE
jgi:Ca-activated chloride channel family protein